MRAEQILTMGRKFGNVLIRTSTSFQTSGKYVISMRREVAGGTKLDHYEVVQTSSGFNINVDNKHSPMRCLADVVEFFVQVAGPGTTPMTTNKMDILFGRSMSVDHSPTSPMSSPNWASTLPPGGGFMDDTRSVHSGFATTAADKLRVKGAVSGQIQRAVTDLNTGFSRSIVPAEIHAPPPAAPPPAPSGNWDPRGQDYVNIASMYGPDDSGFPDSGFGNPALNRTVPAKIPPMETMQRQAGHMDHMSHDMASMYLNQGEQMADTPSVPPPAPPPPPPPGALAPPPPGAGGGIPPPEYLHECLVNFSVNMAVRLTNENLAALKEAFMLFDYDKDGRIFTRDVGPVIRSIGLKPSEAEVKSIMKDVEQGGGDVDLQTLVTLISRKVTGPPPEKPEDLREMFRMYDKDGRGFISVQEMRHLLTTVGEKLTDDEADDLMKMTGCVQKGTVDYNRFVQIVMKG